MFDAPRPPVAPPSPGPADPPARIGLCTAVVALGGLLFGFDTGVISGALLFIRTDFGLNSFEEGAVISALLLGAAVGALGSGRPADRFGRKKVLVAIALTFTAGLLAAVLADGFPALVAARAVLGLAVGSASTVVPLYLAEIAPPRLRGRLVTANQILLTVGILVSYLINLAYADSADWRAMFAVGLIPSVAMVVGTLAIPESPEWLRTRATAGAAPVPPAPGRRPAPPRPSAGLLSPAARPALVIGVTLAAAQQFGGINSIIYYAPSIMSRAGLPAANSITYSVVIGTVNVLMTIAAVPLIDRAGRRPLLLSSLAGMAFSLVALGVALGLPSSPAANVTALVFMVTYVASFAIGLGPVFWILAAELFPPESRARGGAVCALVNWAANFVVGQMFLPAADLVGESWVFWFFAAVSTAAVVFVLRTVPETKNRSLAEVQRELAARSARPAGDRLTARTPMPSARG
ncbi:MFS transporter [Streptomyces leeuwenhoekii]|uniref:Metabolite transport protein ywtG n=1 Tax=Streptomyces leeuwenhoekii TaxID=1437453 RepID=A0A0F7W2H5_STRLW|nr:MFS transporter [Streptomyces leeuwenhoekii]CQR64037.1 Putative metabolite transport protein ywtG [Streptomyces leeuwenhoekii]